MAPALTNPLEAAPPRVSVVIPVYNYAHRIAAKLEQVARHYDASLTDWELVVVDDGSADQTRQVLLDLAATMPNLRVISLERNQGKGAAVVTGLRAASGQHLIFMDCDLAYPLSEGDKLLAALADGAEVAVANRRLPESICEVLTPLLKEVYSRHRVGEVFNWVVRLLFGLSITDTQAGLKAMNASVVPCLDGMLTKRFAFDVEMLLLLERAGARIAQVPIRFSYFESESTVRIARDARRMLAELLRVKWRYWRRLPGASSDRLQPSK